MRFLDVSSTLSYQRQPGMGIRVAAIGHQRSLKFTLRFENQPLVEETHPCFRKGGRVLLWRQRCQARFVHLLHFQCGLAEGSLVEASFDPLQGQVLGLRGWIKGGVHPAARRGGGSRRMLRLSAEGGLERFSLGIGGTKLQR